MLFADMWLFIELTNMLAKLSGGLGLIMRINRNISCRFYCGWIILMGRPSTLWNILPIGLKYVGSYI